MENENARLEILKELEEEIKRHPIKAGWQKFNYVNNHVICPICGKDASEFNASATEITCQNCGEHLNALHFAAARVGTKLDRNKIREYEGLVKTACRVANIPLPDILKPVAQNISVNAAADEKPATPPAMKPENYFESYIPRSEQNSKLDTLPFEQDFNDHFQKAEPKKSRDTPIKKPEKNPAPNLSNETDHKTLLGANMHEFFKTDFSAFVAENQKFKDRKTGFSNIDEEQFCFQSGIYVLGGLPAVGKTTFALQLLSQLAKQGETCIFCSYEMTAGFLYSKLLAQEIFLIESGGWNVEMQSFNHKVEFPLTTSKIVFGNFRNHEDAYQQALKKFAQNPLPLYIWQIADNNLNKLLNKIRSICDNLDKPPIVCIDYLQLLAAGSENVKSSLDKVLRGLFNFRRETNTTFIVISSLNRLNYNNAISFEAFKETGGIEYSADVIWGMQFYFRDENDRKAINIQACKKKNPREIEIQCLKSRFGANYSVGFFYRPDVELFVPMLEYGEFTDITPKSSTPFGDEEDDDND